jgi:hypothetical protein
LRQDLLEYVNQIENGLRFENQRVAKELEDAQLDLDDAKRSRREAQQQAKILSQRLEQFSFDKETLKVRTGFCPAPRDTG